MNQVQKVPPGRHAPLLTEISDDEFALFQNLIVREAGIHLAPSKKSMLVCRLMRRLNTLKLDSFGDYYRHVVYGDKEEMVRLLDAVCTNETWFFRNPGHFNLVRDRICADWQAAGDVGRRLRRVRAWSAACSSGEEPYSLAMVLLDALPGWDIDIVATDLSTRVLDRARAATWPVEKSEDIPANYLKRYMLRGTGSQQGKMKAGSEIREAVSFQRMNLNDDLWQWTAEERFDLIFCRNVLMYFDPARRERVLQRILKKLTPKGYLFLGDAETLNGFEGLHMVAPAVHEAR